MAPSSVVSATLKYGSRTLTSTSATGSSARTKRSRSSERSVANSRATAATGAFVAALGSQAKWIGTTVSFRGGTRLTSSTARPSAGIRRTLPGASGRARSESSSTTISTPGRSTEPGTVALNVRAKRP